MKNGEASEDFDYDGSYIKESGDNIDLCKGAKGFLFN